MFDLDAVAAEAAPGEPWMFQWAGETYTLPAEPDLVAAGAVSGGDLLGGFKRLLGPEQWASIEASDKVLTRTVFIRLLEAYTESIGTSPGESQGSTSS